MNETVIQARNLSKRYVLGATRPAAQSFREMIAGRVQILLHPAIGNSGGRRSAMREFWALRDVSFDVARGEVVGVIGPNGAGKSTLLKILSRITDPTAGSATICGRVGSLLEVGTGFHPELSGRENIYLNGAVLGMSRREIAAKFDAIAAFAEIDRFLDTPVKRYSSGMYVRLAFAVAAHLEPEILIVDEVLAVGDAAFQKRCLGKMGDVARAGRTVLFVSHNLDAVRRLCPRSLLLDGGRIMADGASDQVIAQYVGAEMVTPDQTGFNPSRRLVPPRRVRIVDAWTSLDGQRSAVFSYGQRLRAHVLLQVEQPARVAYELLIRDAQDHPVVFLPSGLRFNREFDLAPGEIELVCDVPELPLATGQYSLDLIAADSGRGFFDYVQSGLTFAVALCDPHHTDRQYRQERGQGCVHLEAQFAIARPDAAAGGLAA